MRHSASHRQHRIFSFIGFTMILAIVFGLWLTSAGKASALTSSDFNPGHIIDDVVFTNDTAMSVIDIQNFLSAQAPSCDTNGSQSKSYYYDQSGDQWNGEVNVSSDGTWVTTTRAVYGQRYAAFWNSHTVDSAGDPRSSTYITNESVAPYVCLKDYIENPSTGQNNLQNPSASVSGGESAAQIIYNAAQAYDINPEVILTTLQKEQGLVTDDWPWLYEYTEAMGYNCPDNGTCSGYAGLYQQVNAAAKQFRNYLNNPNNYNYVVGSDQVAYSPSCSGPTITIQNQATAALYDYTPYQPDPNVINTTNPTGSSSGPGGSVSGDSCAAYGNRNFWWYFNTWFGSSLAPSYSAQPIWQAVYSNNSETDLLGWNATLVESQGAYVVIEMKNTGNTTWTDSSGANPVRLATYPWGSQNPFCTGSWISTSPSCTRPAGLAQASVAPGDIGTFKFPVVAPETSGTYNETFGLVIDGRTTFSSGLATVQFTVLPATYTGQPVSQAIYTDSSKTTLLGWNALLTPGENAWAVVQMKNTSNVDWTSDGGGNDVRLATYPWGRISPFCAGRWIPTNPNCTRAAELDQSVVSPGQVGTFEFPINAPTGISTYNETFGLVIDGRTTFSSGLTNFQLTVAPPVFSAQPVSQAVYTDSNESTLLGWNATLNAGQAAYLVVKMKNTGNTTWTSSGAPGVTDTRMVTYGPWGRQSAFCANGWITTSPPCTRPAALTESSVGPGQIGTFAFPVTAPAKSGVYNEPFGLVVDGRTLFSSGLVNVQFTVH